MADKLLVIRAGRTFIEGSFRPAAVVVEDKRIVDVVGVRDRIIAARTVLVPDDAVLLPGTRRLARARERAGPHRVGGVPLGDPRRGGGRRDHDRRHAAELAPADDDRRGARRSSGPRRRRPPTSTSASGAGRCPRTSARSHRCTTRACSASSASSRPRASTSSRTSIARSCSPRWRRSRRSGRGSSCTPKTRRCLGEEGALGRGYEAFLASRPPASEASAIDAVIDGARRTGARAHILHLSDAHSLPAIRAAKAEGVALTVETCPHYLTIVAEEIPDGASEFKCCPPIREVREPRPALGGHRRRHDRCDRERPLALDRRPQALRRRRLRTGVGRDRGPAGRAVGGVDRGAGARHPAGDDPAAVHDRPRGASPASTGAGVIEPGAPAHLTVFGVDDPFVIDARTAAAQEPDHRVRPPRAERQDPPHLAARQVHVQRDRGRRGRSPALPRQAARPPAVGARDRRGVMRTGHAHETRMQLDGGMPTDMEILQPGARRHPGRALPALDARDGDVGPTPVRSGCRGPQHRGRVSP